MIFLIIFIRRKLFDEIYITTHVNTIGEVMAKESFFSEYLPSVKLFAIPFNDTPYNPDKSSYYDNANRKRTNKPFEFFKSTGENPTNTIFIDDTLSICEQAKFLGATAFHRKADDNNPLTVFYEMVNYVNELDSITKKR